MLISFTIGNFLSFKEKKTLSMEATSIQELKESVIKKDGYKLLPSAVIYGANSSGKSNFLEGITKFKTLVTSNLKLSSTDSLGITPFLLNDRTKNEPSFFEIELLAENTFYRYGFIANNDQFLEEWLYELPDNRKKERCLFVRTTEGIGVTEDFPEGNGMEERTRNNALFLAVLDSFNGTIAKKIIYEISKIFIVSGISHEYFADLTKQLYKQHEDIHHKIDEFFRLLNIGFESFELPEDKESAEKVKAYTFHNLYDDHGEVKDRVRFNMKDQESSGTNKLFDLSAYVVGCLLLGCVLVIDELDSKLHPLLTRQIIRMFNNPETNPNGAQLIFATHDTNLLNIKFFRRDQIWFTEKDKTEATDLYSLVEFKEPDGTKIRNDRSFEKDYINGRYGAIPYIKN